MGCFSPTGHGFFLALTAFPLCVVVTCGVTRVCIERQDFDVFVVGASGQQLSTVTPGDAVDGAFVMFVPPEAHQGLLHRSRTAVRVTTTSAFQSTHTYSVYSTRIYLGTGFSG